MVASRFVHLLADKTSLSFLILLLELLFKNHANCFSFHWEELWKPNFSSLEDVVIEYTSKEMYLQEYK